jgi:psp operon transcriptional activator
VLAEHFGRRMAAELGWPFWPGFGPAAAAALAGHPWPGNVRELRNVVERAVHRWDDPERPVDAIEFDPFASPWRPAPRPAASGGGSAPAAPSTPAAAPPPAGVGFRAAVLAYERSLLEAALERCRYNQRATAQALGLSYDQLRHALRRHDLLDRAR